MTQDWCTSPKTFSEGGFDEINDISKMMLMISIALASSIIWFVYKRKFGNKQSEKDKIRIIEIKKLGKKQPK